MENQKALKNTFQDTTFKVEENSRTFQGVAQKLKDRFKEKWNSRTFQEGVNGVNRLATKGEKYYWLPTKWVKNYRLPTWADIINICFQKKEHFAFFSRKEVTSLNLWLIRWPNGKNFLFFWYRYIATANIKIAKSHLKDATEKTERFLFRSEKCLD